MVKDRKFVTNRKQRAMANPNESARRNLAEADVTLARIDERLTAMAANMVTKADLADLRSELKTDLGDLRSELKTDLGDLRSELKTDLGGLRGELGEVKTDVMWIKRIGGVIIALLALPLLRDLLSAFG